MLLEFSVKNQLLGMKRLPQIVSDTINYFEAEFTFLTTDWDGCVKTAHFTDGTTVYDQVLVDDAIPTTAGLNFAAGTWTVYVHGNSTAYRPTTNKVTFTVEESGVIDGEPLPDVSLTFSEQLLVAATQLLYGIGGSAGDYVWIKYSETEPNSDDDMSDLPGDYMGVYTGNSPTAPTTYTSYTWYH